VGGEGHIDIGQNNGDPPLWELIKETCIGPRKEKGVAGDTATHRKQTDSRAKAAEGGAADKRHAAKQGA